MRGQSVQGFKGPVGTMNRRIEGVEATFAEHEMKFNLIEKRLSNMETGERKGNDKKEHHGC